MWVISRPDQTKNVPPGPIILQSPPNLRQVIMGPYRQELWKMIVLKQIETKMVEASWACHDGHWPILFLQTAPCSENLHTKYPYLTKLTENVILQVAFIFMKYKHTHREANICMYIMSNIKSSDRVATVNVMKFQYRVIKCKCFRPSVPF
jgi:hypothetical protein